MQMNGDALAREGYVWLPGLPFAWLFGPNFECLVMCWPSFLRVFKSKFVQDVRDQSSTVSTVGILLAVQSTLVPRPMDPASRSSSTPGCPS